MKHPTAPADVVAARLRRLLLVIPIFVAASLPFSQSTVSARPPQEAQQSSSATAQQPSAPAGEPQIQVSDKDAPELSASDTDTTFQVRVNLVEVRVVVRDAQGHAVSGLKKEDFQLLDNGTPQAISRFSVDESHEQSPAPQTTRASNSGAPSSPTTAVRLPDRYIAYLFDDVHLPFAALSNARTAAEQQLNKLQPAERAAIFTTSGQTQVDFTDDHSVLRDGLNRISPHPGSSTAGPQCPHMTSYMADMIENRGDRQALEAAVLDAEDCAFNGKNPGGGDTPTGGAAESMARNAARQQLNLTNHDTQVSLDAVRQAVQRLSAMPGRRTMVFVSPGFLNVYEQQQQVRIAERAVHAGIVIDTLDARGLYTGGDDASKGVPARHLKAIWQNVDTTYSHYAELEKSAQADVLRGLAEDTGGTFFHNSNDLGGGFAAVTPEYAYLLAFSPAKLSLDGSFHNLKVVVKGHNYSVQARQGYYAPKHATDAVAEARREIEEAVFSQEQSNDIPVQLHTEFFKLNEEDAKLSVLVRVDARRLRFRKVDGRNCNDVTVISALFNRNGKFISGSEKVLQMRLKDETLGSQMLSGVPLKTSFDVKSGSYLVRLVVRDDGGRLTAQNDAVDIP